MSAFLEQAVVPIVTASVGTLGFSMLFSVPWRHLATATLGGTVAIVMYLSAGLFTDSVFLCNLIAMVFATAYVETMARVKKCPVTLYLIPSVVPLVPGGGLYYTMYYMVDGNWDEVLARGKATLLAALGISMGILIVSVITDLIFSSSKKKKV